MEQGTSRDADTINLQDLWLMLFKRWRLVAGVCLSVMFITAIISSYQSKIYRGEVILKVPQIEVSSFNITPKELIAFLGTIDGAKKVKLFPKTHNSITNIKIEALKDSKDKMLIVLELVTVESGTLAVSELVDSINSFDIVKATVHDERDRLARRSAELSTVIAASEELTNAFTRLLKAGKLVPVGFNPVDLNKRIADMEMEKLVTDQTLRILDGGVSIAKQLYVGTMPIAPKIRIRVVFAGIASLFFAVLLSVILEYSEKQKRGGESE